MKKKKKKIMLKPKQLLIIIYVNVCVKRIYPHKTNDNILFRYGKIPESQFLSHDRVCNDQIRHLNHLWSFLVLSTNRQNQSTTGKLGKLQWPWLGTDISKEMVGWIRFYSAKLPASITVKRFWLSL